MKRGGFLKRKTPLRVLGHSDTSELKREIQDAVRDIVIARDGGCILRDNPHVSACNGYRKDGKLVLQADHLITRANSATYADTRLIVCVCLGHHGWKNWHKKEYEAVVRTVISKERVILWDRAEENSWRLTRNYASDWKLALVALKSELAGILKA